MAKDGSSKSSNGSRFSRSLGWGIMFLALWASPTSCENLKVGVPITFYYDYNLVVTVVMAHLDMMKHFNSTIRERFGPPILEIQNPHPNLSTVEVLTRDPVKSSVLSVAATEDLIFNHNVNALLGDFITEPCETVGAVAAPSAVPHISLCVGDTLGDRERYPYSFRGIIPMSDVYDFMWEYMDYFKFRSAILLYTSDGLGTSLNNIKDYAQQKGSGGAILSVPLIGSLPWDNLTLAATAATIKQSPIRLLVVGVRAIAVDSVNQFIIDYSLTKPRYQVLTSAVVQGGKLFSKNFIGWHYMSVDVSDTDSSITKWYEMRAKMTNEDITSVLDKYGMNDWPYVPFLPSKMPSDEVLQTESLREMIQLLCVTTFNSLNAIFIAMNNLLNLGYAPDDIRGTTLMGALLSLDIPGVGRNTTFDSNQDALGLVRFLQFTNITMQFEAESGETVLLPVAEEMFRSTANLTFPAEIPPILWPDDTYATEPPPEYNQCHPGMYIQDSGACGECPDGSYSDAFDTEECTSCALGTYSNENRTECLNCTAGHIASERGLSACTACPVGQYMPNGGASACSLCPAGTYATSTGSTACEECPSPLSTAGVGSSSASSCICPSGTYSDANGNCVSCGEGLSCVAGATLANLPTSEADAATSNFDDYPYPEVEAGYYTTYEDPLSVYLCLEAEYCPGGLPESCMQNSVGIGCGNCIEGYYRDASGACSSCTSVMRTRGLLISIPTILIPVIYILSLDTSDITTWYRAKNMVPCLVYIALFFVQALAMYSVFSIELPDNTQSFANSVSFSLDFRTLLRPECAEFYDYSANFAAGLATPLYFAMVVLVTWAIGIVASRYWSEMGIRWCCALSFFGASYSTLYVSIANLTLNLFACYDHPNGKWSLRSASHQLCYEGDWNALVGVGVVGIFVYCIIALVLMVFAIWRAPRYYTYLTYRLATKFLFVRFRMGYAWWSIVLLVKGLLVSMTPVLFTDGVRQFMWINVVFTTYVPLAASLLPWRSYPVAVLDIFSHMVLCYAFGLGGFFTATTEEDKVVVSRWLFACVGCVGAGVVLGALHIMYTKYQQDYKEDVSSTDRGQLASKIVVEMKRLVDNPDTLTYLLKVLPDADITSFRAIQSIISREAAQSMSVSCGLDPKKPSSLSSPSLSEVHDDSKAQKEDGPIKGQVLDASLEVTRAEKAECVYV